MRVVPARTVAVIGAVCVTIGWIVASTLTPPVAQSQSLPGRAEKPSLPGSDATFAEQLHFKLRQAPDPPVPRRNPFSFGQAPRPAAATSLARPEPVAEAAPLAPTPPVAPRFKLSGIGVTGELRTAVLAEGQTVHIVKPGDGIGGYIVADITDDSVTLIDPLGLRHILRLR